MTSGRTAFIAAVVSGALAGGAVGFWQSRDGEPRDEARPAAKTADTAAPIVGESARQAQEDLGRRIIEFETHAIRLKEEAAAAEGRAADLARQNAVLGEEIRVLKTRLEREEEDRARKLERLSERLAKLREGQFQAVLNPGALADVINEIKDLGDEGINALVAMLGAESPEDRRLAAQIMMSMNDPRTIDPLYKTALDDKDAQAAAWASQALIRMESSATVPSLKALVENSAHAGVKVNALWGLCKHGDDDGIAKAFAYYRDESKSEGLRNALGQGVLLLRGEKLLDFYDSVVEDSGRPKEVLSVAIEYWGSLKSAAGRDRLQRIVNDAKLDEATRAAARRALNGG